ncbi:LuxR C-terminal-related transcriptional regulator [Cohnella hashimotonis]|uniref:LuxR C-terminal-related transcriptional regulator n=1 Tax=Cohnella hashimotonis TaxID=2826895 RepID=A0ABT6TN95_9BACL|nr:LuxR C-terminal-related transcriptional regulator [Cohnella hashimotonis]MDI4648332.1 LuxR C-terminal-related transcriptional regulator [Cohnella hashimotonis]
MPSDIILRTKIRIPPVRRDGIVRTRLLERMDHAFNGRLTELVAPAGFGKTTLLTQFLTERKAPAAWLSLDDTDNDPAKFWRYFIQAIGAVIPELPARALPLLDAYPNVSRETMADMLLGEIDEFTMRTGQPLAIALDDYHAIHDERIHDSLAYFIDQLPDGAHLIIASRTQPPVKAAKWRARGQSTEIAGGELTFTVDETRRFCEHTAKLSLTTEQVDRIVAWTEGWAAIVQLLSVSLEGRDAGSLDRLSGHAAGGHGDIMAYLAEEVLSRLPDELRRFLLDTSVTERFDAVTCDALTGRDDGARMLGELRRRNLFLVSLDDGGVWFRYHHIFRDVLKNELLREDPARAKRLSRAAALRFSELGLYDEAMEQVVQGGNDELAAELLQRHLYTVLGRGEFSTLLRWMQAISPASLPAELHLLHAFALVVTGQYPAAEAALITLERDIHALPDDGRRGQLQSGLFFVKVNYAFSTGDYDQWLKYADRIPDMLPESPLFYNLNYNKSEPLVRRTLFGLNGAIPPNTNVIALRMVDIMNAHGWKQSLFSQYVVQSVAEGYFEWDRVSEADSLLKEVETIAYLKRCAGLYVPCRITMARVLQAKGRGAEARSLLQSTAETTGEWGESRWEMPLAAYEARFALAEGDLAGAERLLKRTGVGAADTPALYRETEYMTLARLLGARRKEKEALRLLEGLTMLGARERSLITTVDASVLRALLEWQRGRREAALDRLQEALAAGAANGYVRSFTGEGKPMLTLLQAYRAKRLQPVSAGEEMLAGDDVVPAAYVEGLIARLEAELEAAGASPAEGEYGVERLIEPLTDKELALLQELDRGATNRESAAKLQLTEGTVKVYLSRVYAKLGVSSRTQALSRARELRLLD